MRKAKKAVSLLLCAVLGVSSFVTASAQTVGDAPAVNPVSVVVEQAGGSMNLTDTGTLDWVHMTSEKINRKAGVEPAMIEISQLNPTDGLTTMSDCPVSYSWSDGSPDETDTGNTKGAVYNWKNGDDSSVGVAIPDDAGYKISIPAADYPRVLTFVSGVWNSEAGISIYANGDATPVYTNAELKAGGDAVNKKYTINIRSGNSLEVVCKMTQKGHSYGNLNLSAIALGKMEMPDSVKVDIKAASGGMNLTEMGDLDWVHLTGLTNSSSTSKLITTRKAGVEPQIVFETFKDNDTTTRQTDSKVAFTWTDGTSNGGEEYNAMTASKLGGVMNYKNGQVSSIGNLPADAEAGYRMSVPSSETARTLTFVSGVWQSQGVISIYLNGEADPVYSVALEAGGSAVANIYTISLSANDSAVVEFRLKSKTHESGNIAIGAITLGTDSVGLNFKTKLANLVKSAEGYDVTDIDEFFVNQLNAELAYSKALLGNENATNEAYYEAYTYLKAAFDAVEANTGDRNYTYKTASGLTSSFGWEGDIQAPIAYIDGSYKLRDRGNLMITFGVWDIPGKIAWYNKEGYLPCFVSEYEKNGLSHTVESFADLVTINGNKFEIAYSRMTTTNNTETVKNLPRVSAELIALNDAAENALTIQPGETIVRDYAIGADRFGGSYAYPADSVIKAEGGWDTHYTHMKDYWNTRLEPLAQITKLPDEKLINAYKAGFIYTLIIRDDVPQSGDSVNRQLHVGENGYDTMYDHDTIGIVATLLTIGDYTYAKDYLYTLPAQLQYDDAKWKYSWPYALYYQKTGDLDFIKERFDAIKTNTHNVETDRIDNGNGIIKKTNAIDSNGYWLIDNWAALAGLTTYKYLCEAMLADSGDAQYTTEIQWADAQYASLLAATEKAQKTMRETYDYPYLSIDMNVPTEQSARKDARDGNWASMFLFGRWSWDGYLFGADQEGSEMIDLIDDTYTHGFDRRSDISDTIYNFGGYPHGYFSSAYNAGYGSAALRGEEYRDAGIKAYQFMIEEAMSGPFGWWEGVDYPKASSPWDIDHAARGGGSCQHMWGQSTATKVLFDSLIAAKSDGSAIIGRGIPKEWIVDGEEIEVTDYPVTNARMGFNITTTGKTVTLTLTGDNSKTPVSLELLAFKDNIASVSGNLSFDEAAGTVAVPAGAKTVTVTLKRSAQEIVDYEKAVENANKAVKDGEAVDVSLYTTYTGKAVQDAVAAVKALLNDDNATTTALTNATKAVTDAINALAPLSVGEIGVDYQDDNMVGHYTFGDASDQVRRYQTFKTGELAGTLGYIDVPVNKLGEGTFGDIVATLYTLEADNKTLKDEIAVVRIAADKVVGGQNNRLYFSDVTLTPNTYYALALGQDRSNVTGNPRYSWHTGPSKGDDLFFMKDKGDGTFQDETNLGTGMMTIFFEEYNKSDLDTAVVEADSIKQPGYTGESFEAFSQARAAAKAVLNNPNATKAEYENAKTALAEAKEALVEGSAADTEMLEGLVDKCAALLEDDYTADSWAKLQTALTEAQAVLENLGASQDEVNAAYNKLADAYAKLEDKATVNKTELKKLIDEAKLIDTTGCRPGKVEIFEKALKEAETVYGNPDATWEQVKEAADALLEAIVNLKDIVDKTTLDNLIKMLSGLDSSLYTTESFGALTAAIDAAKVVLGDDNTSAAQVDDAYKAMQKAFNGLVRVEKTVNLKALQNIIRKVEIIVANINDYMPKTVEGLKSLLDEAKALLSKEGLTQAEVDEMTDRLTAKAAAARVKEDKTALLRDIQKASAYKASDYTPESFGVLTQALVKAKLVAIDDNATAEDIKKAQADIKSAVDGLVKKSAGGSDTPTGDGNAMPGLLITALGAAMVLVFAKKKKVL